ncbi:hypothetical protein STENM36S_06347 [Streptomyces tendae]
MPNLTRALERSERNPAQTAPLNPAAAAALARLESKLGAADVQKAAARYRVASAAIAKASQVLGARALTEVEASDFDYMQDVMREARTVLAAAGQLDLIGGV